MLERTLEFVDEHGLGARTWIALWREAWIEVVCTAPTLPPRVSYCS